MFKKTAHIVAIGLAVAAIAAAPAEATPSGSQHLRGMGGRSFAVHVTGDDGSSFVNCYGFDANGDWFDAALDSFVPGLLGSWEQQRNGASTPYEAWVDFGPAGVLVQTGHVTPAHGSGVLQLHATTVVPAGLLGPDVVTLMSVGSEIDSC